MTGSTNYQSELLEGMLFGRKNLK